MKKKMLSLLLCVIMMMVVSAGCGGEVTEVSNSNAGGW